jgi:hypothetical protein
MLSALFPFLSKKEALIFLSDEIKWGKSPSSSLHLSVEGHSASDSFVDELNAQSNHLIQCLLSRNSKDLQPFNAITMSADSEFLFAESEGTILYCVMKGSCCAELMLNNPNAFDESGFPHTQFYRKKALEPYLFLLSCLKQEKKYSRLL